jgi:hypothetical protein
LVAVEAIVDGSVGGLDGVIVAVDVGLHPGVLNDDPVVIAVDSEGELRVAYGEGVVVAQNVDVAAFGVHQLLGVIIYVAHEYICSFILIGNTG